MKHGRGLAWQADVFSYGCIMYEVMCGTIVSQLVVGPTGDELAATVYSAKVGLSGTMLPPCACLCARLHSWSWNWMALMLSCYTQQLPCMALLPRR